MSKAARSVLVFGVYVLIMGLTLMIVPNALLGLFRYPTSDEVWVRVVGFLAATVGYYYIVAARSELTPFFEASVRARPFLIVCFIVFVSLGLAKPVLVLFGAIDLLGAIWTWLMLRSSNEGA